MQVKIFYPNAGVGQKEPRNNQKIINVRNLIFKLCLTKDLKNLFNITIPQKWASVHYIKFVQF
jgi:hypothetical protein